MHIFFVLKQKQIYTKNTYEEKQKFNKRDVFYIIIYKRYIDIDQYIKENVRKTFFCREFKEKNKISRPKNRETINRDKQENISF
jgi:ribosomal protein S10